MIKGVEHLNCNLAAQLLGEAEPFSQRQILVDVVRRPEIGEVPRSTTEGKVRWSRKGFRIEEAVLLSNWDRRDAVGTAATASLKTSPGQIGVLATAKDRRRIATGSDRHWESALECSDSRQLPASDNCIFNSVHAAPKLLSSAEGQIVYIVEDE